MGVSTLIKATIFAINMMINSSNLWIEQLKLNEQGLIPAIAQDYRDGTVLLTQKLSETLISLCSLCSSKVDFSLLVRKC
ncbi:MAG: hypothetical protein VKL59_17455 [Nostocaceae cyanobacterium]|nr:hypothetical protein [Nostocaceae cyanobacterium]